MKIVDKKGKWMLNTSQFRMHDPLTNTFFEVGEPTKATDSPWRQLNKAVVQLCNDEGDLVDDPDLTIVLDTDGAVLSSEPAVPAETPVPAPAETAAPKGK